MFLMCNIIKKYCTDIVPTLQINVASNASMLSQTFFSICFVFLLNPMSGCYRKFFWPWEIPPKKKNSKQMSMNMTAARFSPKQILNTSYTL